MSESISTVQGGVHLVGSIPAATVEQVFTKASKALSSRLRRIPDGEPGERNNFIFFQRPKFEAHAPGFIFDFSKFGVNDADDELTEDEVQKKVDAVAEFDTGYDEAAIESWATFKRLRDEGVIATHTRFMVGLPTVICFVGGHVKPVFRKAIEPLYERSMFRASANIYKTVPLKDLCIQWDVAVDFALLEKAPFITPWFEPVLEGVVERLIRLGDNVPVEAELGFHLCYGDVEHKHFLEPTSAGTCVAVIKGVLAGIKRPVTYFHLPVPKSRDDKEYFEPLADPEFKRLLGKTEIYLGLVHAGDLEGTQKRIATAKTVIDNFGVATECGMGRTPPHEIDSIFEISAAVTSPVV